MEGNDLCYIKDIFKTFLSIEFTEERLKYLWEKLVELRINKDIYYHFDSLESYILCLTCLLQGDYDNCRTILATLKNEIEFEPYVYIALGYSFFGEGKKSIESHAYELMNKSSNYLILAISKYNMPEEIIAFAYMLLGRVYYEWAEVFSEKYLSNNEELVNSLLSESKNIISEEDKDKYVQKISEEYISSSFYEIVGNEYYKSDFYEKAFVSFIKAERFVCNGDFGNAAIPAISNRIGDALQKLIKPASEILKINKLEIYNPYVINDLLNKGFSNNLELARDYYEAAHRIDDNYIYSHNGLGRYYKKMGNYEKAKKCFEKALEGTDFTYPHTYLGDCYLALGEYENAIESYNNALRNEKFDPSKLDLVSIDQSAIFKYRVLTYTLYGLGKVYYEKGKSEDPKSYYKQALFFLELAYKFRPNFAYVNMHLGRLLLRKQLYDESIKDSNYIPYESNSVLSDARKYFIRAAIGFQARGYDDRANEMLNNITKLNDIETFFSTPNIQNAINPEYVARLFLYHNIIKSTLGHIDAEQFTNKKAFSRFLGTSYIDSDSNFCYDEITVEVLRRWNSFTPLVTGGTGGGYFIKINNYGLVVDPGFGFIQNFRLAGHKFSEINAIFISHAHDDHTADLESIINLLNRYNKELKNEYIVGRLARDQKHTKPFIKDIINIGDKESTLLKSDAEIQKVKKAYDNYDHDLYMKINKEFSINKKEIQIIFPKEVEDKFEGIFRINNVDNPTNEYLKIRRSLIGQEDKDCYLENCSTNPNNLSLIDVYHKTFNNNYNQGYGFVLSRDKIALVYTSDTGFNYEIMKKYKELKQKLEDQEIILIAHLGGFEQKENTINTQIAQNINKNTSEQKFYTNIFNKSFYESHLGRLGLVEACIQLKPALCIISEFGEEFKGLRKDIADVFNKTFEDTEYINTVFLPGDFGLNIKFGINMTPGFCAIDPTCQMRSCDKIDSKIRICAITGVNKYSLEIEENWIDYKNVRYCEIQDSIFYYEKDLNYIDVIHAISAQYNRIPANIQRCK
ncbi:MAG: tetratricopeptide repeat protein [Herbinix sp.]|nr:tetratricopeptide repeat protein [Herbinix sp.]